MWNMYYTKAIIKYYHEIPKMLKLLRKEQEALEDTYDGLHAMNLDGMPHASISGKTEKPTESLALLLDEKNTQNRLEEIHVKMQVLHADAAMIRSCLDILGGRYQRVLSMRYQNGYSWAKISIELGRSDSTIRHWHDKAVIRLGKLLEDVPMSDELLSRALCART